LRGLVAELAGRGLKVDYRSVWEFVHTEELIPNLINCDSLTIPKSVSL
jgi:transposase